MRVSLTEKKKKKNDRAKESAEQDQTALMLTNLCSRTKGKGRKALRRFQNAMSVTGTISKVTFDVRKQISHRRFSERPYKIWITNIYYDLTD